MSGRNSGSFWSSVPGVLTGLAAIITAMGSLLAVVYGEKPDDGTTIDPVPVPSDECIIKGNISQNAGKVYHLPVDKGYAATEIDVSRGERWFCTEIEAQKAGWTRAQQQ